MSYKYYLSALLLTCVWSGCDLTESVEKNKAYKLTATASPEEGGTIIQSSSSSDKGEQITLRADPFDEWRFIRWVGDLNESAPEFTLLMDRDYTLVAVFAKKEYPLTIHVEGNGSVSEQIIPAKSDYETGTIVLLTAYPENGWYFDGWQGDLSGNENPATLTIDKETIVIAVFKRTESSLTVSVDGQGWVSEQVAMAKTNYETGTKVTLTAHPDEEWLFDHWEEDLTGNKNPVTITVDREMSVVAVFKKRDSLIIHINGQGNVKEEIVSGETGYGSGTIVKLSADPKDGWILDRWEGDLTGNENPATITLDGEKSVTAVFRPRKRP